MDQREWSASEGRPNGTRPNIPPPSNCFPPRGSSACSEAGRQHRLTLIRVRWAVTYRKYNTVENGIECSRKFAKEYRKYKILTFIIKYSFSRTSDQAAIWTAGIAVSVFRTCWKHRKFDWGVALFSTYWASPSSNCKIIEKNLQQTVDISHLRSIFHSFAEMAGKMLLGECHPPVIIWVFLVKKFDKYWDLDWSVCKGIDWSEWVDRNTPTSLKAPQVLHSSTFTQEINDRVFCKWRSEHAFESNFSPKVKQNLICTDLSRFLTKRLELSNSIQQIIKQVPQLRLPERLLMHLTSYNLIWQFDLELLVVELNSKREYFNCRLLLRVACASPWRISLA